MLLWAVESALLGLTVLMLLYFLDKIIALGKIPKIIATKTPEKLSTDEIPEG